MQNFNINEYLKQTGALKKEKEIKAPSGFTFKIKKLTQKQILKLTNSLSVFNATQVSNPTEKFQKIDNNINIEEQYEYMQNLIIESVIEPILTLDANENDENKLHIDNISMQDYNILISEITKFSLPTVEKKDALLPSPKVYKSSRCNGKKIRNKSE